MRKIFFIIIIMLFAAFPKVNSQERMEGDRPRIPIEKIEQLEKAKLIEILDLNEETAIRFFTRRKEFREKEREQFKKRDDMVRRIEDKIRSDAGLSDKESKDHLSEVLAIDQKIVADKEKFFRSLNDILTPEQVLKLVVFDNRFMREIRDLLIGRPRGKRE